MCLPKRFAVAIVATMLSVCGCDGRGGSSGLDVVNENAAIREALDTRRCSEFEDLTICPTDEPSTETPSIDTPLANATSLDCFQATPGGSCTYTLRFTAHSFPPNTTFKVLARPDASTNPWVLGPDPVVVSGGEAPSYDATLVLASVQGGTPNQVQLAILAFADSTTSATEVDELRQTAATIAFVTEVLAINVVTPTPLPTPTRRATNTATATSTPGVNDCCQCPSSCAAPVDGMCASNCTIVAGTTCFGEQLCVLNTPTATPTTPAPCLQDNGDGTITDGCSGLTWEKKDQVSGLHDFSAEYPWSGICENDRNTSPCQPSAGAAAACAEATNGFVGCAQCGPGIACIDVSRRTPVTTVWSWLEELNSGQGFAGHNDWRIPKVGEDGAIAELETTLLPACNPPGLCVQPVFDTNCAPGRACSVNIPCNVDEVCIARADVPNETCQSIPGCTISNCSCTWAQYYWSSTLASGESEGFVWALEVSGGTPVVLSRGIHASVRAVRGERVPTPISMPHTPTPTPPPCLHDNGDGTVSDSCTNLTWEKKDQAGELHDYRSVYTWAGACSGNTALCQPNAAAAAVCSEQTGGALGCDECAAGSCLVDPNQHGATTTIWNWLRQLNEQGLAGYNDWRIPSVGIEGGTPELETILGRTSPPCAPLLPIFNSNCSASTEGCSLMSCSCTWTETEYWTATTQLTSPGHAQVVFFGQCGGIAGAGSKTDPRPIRAVRGGS